MKTFLFLFALLFSYSIQVENVQLNIDNYKSLIEDTKDTWVVEFFSSMCGTCQEFKPTWEKVIKRVEGAKIGQINIDDPKGMKLAEKLKVLEQGIPNVKVITSGDFIIDVMKGSEELKEEELYTRIFTIQKKLENGRLKKPQTKKENKPKDDL